MNDIVPVTRRALVLAAATLVALPFAAQAQDASPWTRDSHAQIRLLGADAQRGSSRDEDEDGDESGPANNDAPPVRDDPERTPAASR